MIDEREAQLIGQLGSALGLDKEFVSQAQANGQQAVIDRVVAIDELGALTRLMLVVQGVAMHAEERIITGEGLQPGETLRTVAAMAERADIEPVMAATLVDGVLWLFWQAAGFLMKGNGDD